MAGKNLVIKIKQYKKLEDELISDDSNGIIEIDEEDVYVIPILFFELARKHKATIDTYDGNLRIKVEDISFLVEAECDLFSFISDQGFEFNIV